MVYDDEVYTGIDFAQVGLTGVEFNGCQFTDCSFVGVSLASKEFTDCCFERCNLSQSKVARASFINSLFEGCKLLGVDFSEVNKFQFTARFQGCNLDYSIFIKRNLKGFVFRTSSLKSALFQECNISKSTFDGSLLLGTTFDRCDLTHADFRAAEGLVIDPTINKLKGARFSHSNVLGLLHPFGVVVE